VPARPVIGLTLCDAMNVMSIDPDDSNSQRLARVQRELAGLRRLVKVGLVLLGAALLALLIPPLRAAMGVVLLVVAIIAGVLLFIAFVMWLLDRLFSNEKRDGGVA
jgi:hypothetical protein